MAKSKLTVQRIAAFACALDRDYELLRDTDARGLAVRATAKGEKSYVFEAKLNSKTIRITIGSIRTWTILGARAEATRLRAIVDGGRDPRHVQADELAREEAERRTREEAAAAAARTAMRAAISVGEAWSKYLDAQRSKWTDTHYLAHLRLSQLGGQPKKRGKGLTVAGPLAALLPLPLSEITTGSVTSWLATESAKRATAAALSFRLLRAFANWTAGETAYSGIIPADAFTAKKVKQMVPKGKARRDCLQKEQLAAWFAAVRAIPNRVASAYLQILLLTGARRGELADLKWCDVDFNWGGSMTLRDKATTSGKNSGTRTIALTPYVASLLHELKRLNEAEPNVRQLRRLEKAGRAWEPSPQVFTSAVSKDGKLSDPRYPLNDAMAKAGIPHVTLHGLRRSFKTLCQWIALPAGIAKQITGHKPQGVDEQHYIVRPLDMLRMYHGTIEAWFLEQAGISVEMPVRPPLKVVPAAA